MFVVIWGVVYLVSTHGVAESGKLPLDRRENCYNPIEGGWSLSLSSAPNAEEMQMRDRIGTVSPGDNARLHRRPLYPPADKSLLWNEEQRAKFPHCGFRPLILAYNEPRFLFDFHSAGGLLGHLYVGLIAPDQGSKWFHRWQNIDVQYVEGRMEYHLSDPDFLGVQVHLTAGALANSVGAIVKVDIDNAPHGTSLVWGYGGASAFFTNYDMTNPHFRFSPEHCLKDEIAMEGVSFRLIRAFDQNDSVMEQPFAVARFLPEWKACVSGGSSWKEPVLIGDPAQFDVSPKALLDSVYSGISSKKSAVAVQNVPLHKKSTTVYMVVGMGGDIDSCMQKPKAAFESMLKRNREIASRVTVSTPDPYLNAAATIMAFALDGTWGDSTVMHGGWSWRYGYLGWRGWYGPLCYGWTDRIKSAIKTNTSLGRITGGEDAGALTSCLEWLGGCYYNMNEVFLDHTRSYFRYTNDLELMREIFPILCGIVDWENRRLQPEQASLYENCLNTWISDSHWYIQGQCAQASAYMLNANQFLAELAARLGLDDTPYKERAQRILAAMQQKLWMEDRGVYAEYLDTRGERLLHTEPELPTIYHTAEFGAATPLQIGRMLDWVKANLRHEQTPGGGTLVWSSNWVPNNGRSYTHSTYELAYAECLNLALTQFAVGRCDDGYAIMRGTLCGIFNGPTPGGLSCHAFTDGRQRANDEFADAESMWARTLTEGLFGIQPNFPDNHIRITLQPISAWNQAHIKTPYVSYGWTRDTTSTTTLHVTWETPRNTVIHWRFPKSWGVRSVRLNRNVLTAEEEQGVWLFVRTPAMKSGKLEIVADSLQPAVPKTDVPPRQDPLLPVWNPLPPDDRDLTKWNVVDLGKVFNATIPDALEKADREATPPPEGARRVGFDYWREHIRFAVHGGRQQPPSDEAWRKKVDQQGIAWTTDNIPFKTSKDGQNIAVVTLTGVYPQEITFPVQGTGKCLYLMISGISFPVQSHVEQLRVTLHYDDGEEAFPLVSPYSIGDCWSSWCGRWHDTPANGFENLGGRFGPAGSAEVSDRTKPVNVDTEAHLLAFPLREGKKLQSVTLRAVANDVLYGIMGASVRK